MVNFPKDESLMVAGLDLWEEIFRNLRDARRTDMDMDEFIVEEERLARRLQVKNFRLPPDFRQHGPGVMNAGQKVPFVRFPRWHYCPRCGHMEFLSLFKDKKPRCRGLEFDNGLSCRNEPDYRRQILIPVRFVAACPVGHIQDFPFMEWAHNGNSLNEGRHELRLRAGRSSGSITGIEVSCTCGVRKTLAGAFNVNALDAVGVKCAGKLPWLGQEHENCQCGQTLTVVQKGGSNVYFPQVKSSIYLPQWDESVDTQFIEVLENNWQFLNDGRIDGAFDRKRFEYVVQKKLGAPFEKTNDWTDRLITAANKRRERPVFFDDSEEKYRKTEYDAILTEPGSQNQDFYVTKHSAGFYNGSAYMASWFRHIALLHKLRETRAFTGFTRLLPDDNKTLEDRKNFIKLGHSIDWLPAIVVRGEGVFFEFNGDQLRIWANSDIIRQRAQKLSDNYNQHRNTKENITPEFILIHTFAHLVINQFSFECGYGSSALRERIYCNLENPDEQMHGVLIYTASGDSEGSLGGLVRQGKPSNLETIVLNAIENARWCSSDPVCIDSVGQGPGSCNLAACHNCALLPETCCERSNMLLDRAMVVGTLEEPGLGYFAI